MATIIGISGPSSSGKTTLTRLLQRVFNSSSSSPSASSGIGTESQSQTGTQAETGIETNPLRTFIIHEDDFYFPDDQIPITTLPTGTAIQDWDCASAIDIPLLRASLGYVRANGSLPPRLRSKEDLNEVAESGVDDRVVEMVRGDVQRRLSRNQEGKERVVAFLEGFLLYAPLILIEGEKEEGEGHALHSVHQLIDVRLFLPAPYDKVKSRRESRSGYVTIGPAPTPTTTKETPTDKQDKEVDLEAEDDRPPQNFWTDPPGYVDDIVWPRYVQDHSWLLLPEGESGRGGDAGWLRGDAQEMVRLVGQGVNVRTDAGVTVAPGQGDMPMTEVLHWAVEEVMKHLEKTIQ